MDTVIGANHDLWQAVDPTDYRDRVGDCRRRQPDLLVIGGSPAQYAIDPAVFAGMRWHGQALERPFNLALPLATTSEVFHATERAADVPPRLLVYGITATDLNDGRRVSEGPEWLMSLPDVVRWGRCHPRSARWCVHHYLLGKCERAWRLFEYRNGIRLWAAHLAEEYWHGCCPEPAAEAEIGLILRPGLTEMGFRPPPDARYSRLDQLKAAGSYGPPFPYLDSFRMGEHLTYLHHLIDWATAHDVSLVLVDMPVSADLEERMFPWEFKAYRAALDEVARTRGVPVLWASRQALDLNDTDFADIIHLNSTGAARLSDWLRRALADGGGADR
jgi:hypothetical protein